MIDSALVSSFVPVVDADAPGATDQLREVFERDGVVGLAPVIPAALVERAAIAMDDVIAGRLEGGEVFTQSEPSGAPTELVKIDQPHWANGVLRELVTFPELGRWCAALSRANLVQVFAVQLLYKPSDAPGSSANVGWHQDDTYWRDWWQGEAFTAWVALSDVTPDSGPVRFVPGSQKWGNIGDSDFWGRDMDANQQRFNLPEGEQWRESAAVLPPGGVSFHSRLTMHGSSVNTSGRPRRSLAIHMRTERATPVTDSLGYTGYRNADRDWTPVIFGGGG